MKRSTNYNEQLLERLKDTEYSLAYLNECLNDEDPRVSLNALRNVIDAQNNLSS